jgi:hypothetical protein
LLSLVVHKDVSEDIEAIRKVDEVTVFRIVALIQELQNDQDLLDRLTQQGYGVDEDAPFNIKRWVRQQNQGRNLWRLRALKLGRVGLGYRIVYRFEPILKRYQILAIPHKSFNYDDNHPITKRIEDAYDAN